MTLLNRLAFGALLTACLGCGTDEPPEKTGVPIKETKDAFKIGKATRPAAPASKKEIAAEIAKLKDDDWKVREAAAKRLEEIGDATAVEPLIAVLDDTWWYVQMEAAEALGNSKDRRAVKPLIGLFGHNERHVRAAAAVSLGKIGDASAVPDLIELLQDRDGVVRAVTARALRTITGDDPGLKYEDWKAWQEKHKK
jgi:HEAT repeat protein